MAEQLRACAAAFSAILLLALPGGASAAQQPEEFLSCGDDFPVAAEVDWAGAGRPPVSHRGAPDDDKYWVFIIGAPRGGTSAMYGLLSTSPSMSNLCKGRWGLCEGTWDIMEAGRLPWVDKNGKKGTQWRPHEFPLDWNDIVDNVYTKRWNTSQPVLLEKSPPNVGRIREIYEQLKGRRDRKVRFIIVTQSPCLYGKGTWEEARRQLLTWRGTMTHLVTQLEFVPQEYWLHVKMEDLFKNPYKESKRVLDFIPALQKLDPESTGLRPRVQKAAGNQLERHKGIMGYIRQKQGELMNRTTHIGTTAYNWVIKALGYNRHISPAPLLVPNTPQALAFERREAFALARAAKGRQAQ
eukprot:TRINITY_DN3997_c0_g1_i2.p1 TRINITY_DN3997_c0_g1~~TRINITY_DN3997_c0_g1_i2.p1  ORF type:complete len:384 (+),score=127.29 TRINITY_DN3997_c0_g1_i2:94-1152(+)